MSTFRERLELVRRETRCPKKSAFARWIGADSPQAVGQWEKRGVSKEGALLIHKATGADMGWLLSGEGKPFPGGPKIHPGAAPAPNGLQNDIRALRFALAAVVNAVARTTPGAAAELLAAFDRVPEEYRSQGLISGLMAGVRDYQIEAAAVLPAARRPKR